MAEKSGPRIPLRVSPMSLVDALEALQIRARLAILALRRGDEDAAIREIECAVRDLRSSRPEA